MHRGFRLILSPAHIKCKIVFDYPCVLWVQGNAYEASSKPQAGELSMEAKAFDVASQIWNHTIYFNSLSPTGGTKPTGHLFNLIETSFDSWENFEKQFSMQMSGIFGSGYAWLYFDPADQLLHVCCIRCFLLFCNVFSSSVYTVKF